VDKQLVIQLIAIFLLTQAIGLIVANTLIKEDVRTTIVNDNPQDPLNSVGLIVYILFFTLGILIAIKFLKKNALGMLLKALEIFAIFGTSALVFSVFVPEIAIMLAIILVILRISIPQSILLRNLASVFATAGVGALIGVSLGIIPIILFIALLSVYDLIAVFKTKHMVTMAKAITSENLAFTFALPTKNHQFELGTGDMVIPLAFASSAFAQNHSMGTFFALIPALLILYGSIIGLIITIDYASKHVGKALPALPLQTGIMVVMFLLGKFFGY